MNRVKYRLGAAIIVRNAEGLLLACERRDIPGAWQLPQGGIDVGESPEDACLRELKEEIGTDQVEILQTTHSAYCYQLPIWQRIRYYLGQRPFLGQCHYYFLTQLLPSALINPNTASGEFHQCSWITAEELLEQVVDFKQPAIHAAFKELGLI